MNSLTARPARPLGLLSAALLLAGALAAQALPQPDPSQQEVPLPCADDWQARLVFDAGVGVWTIASGQVRARQGCPEIIALDDRGRCTVLRSYSGKWTPEPTIEDGQWLAPIACGDLDRDQQGLELYTGGQGGRLWQIWPRPTSHFDSRVVHEWPGKEIHTLVLGDMDPGHAGSELLVFLASGEVSAVMSGDQTKPGLELREIAQLSGRVRQAVILPALQGQAPWIATVSRTGEVTLVRLRAGTLEQRPIAREPMGLGRIVATPVADGSVVLYLTRDDGLILRFAGRPGGDFTREIIYAGPQGPRGIATGRFYADPRRESIAIFGYSKQVELLSRLPGEPWQRELIFTDVDKGHWLTTAEVDGRNSTDELIGSGYAGRVFLLSRPPGYGLSEDQLAIPPRVDAGASDKESSCCATTPGAGR